MKIKLDGFEHFPQKLFLKCLTNVFTMIQKQAVLCTYPMCDIFQKLNNIAGAPLKICPDDITHMFRTCNFLPKM